MDANERESVQVYTDLARQMLAGVMPIPDFEQQFFDAWGRDPAHRSPETYAVLDRFFFIVEDYVHDDSLRDPHEGDLDADQLRAGARRFLEELSAL